LRWAGEPEAAFGVHGLLFGEFEADAGEEFVFEFVVEQGIELFAFFGAGIGERPFADDFEVAIDEG
jgi:hypothetical protein